MSGTETDTRMMAGTGIGVITTTGMLDGTVIGSPTDDTSNTTGIIPLVTEGTRRTTTDSTIHLEQTTVIKVRIIRNGISRKVVTLGIRNMGPQVINRHRTQHSIQDQPRVPAMPNPAIPVKHTAITAGKKAITVTSARRKATINDRQ
jgi:hypothetical protein